MLGNERIIETASDTPDPRQPAPRCRRLAALFLDVLLGNTVFWIMLVLLPFRAFNDFQVDSNPWIPATFLGWLLVLVGCARAGRSPGRALLGAVLVRRDGRPSGWGRTLVRDLGSICLAIPFLMDPILGTRVVAAGDGSHPIRGLVLGSSLAIILALGCWAVRTGMPDRPCRESLAEMRRAAIPLPLVSSAPIGQMVSDARLVAAGEATHGDCASATFKADLFKYLVEHQGFTVLAVEGDYAQALALNDYLAGGPGNPLALLRGLGFWTLGTTEMLDLIRWIRDYNLNPGHLAKVRYYGIDCQSPAAAWIRARESLNQAGPEMREWAGRALAGLEVLNGPSRNLTPDQVRACLELAGQLERRLELPAGSPSPGPEGEAGRCARHCVRVLCQALALAQAGGQDPALRDRFMAENVQWLMEHGCPGGKAMLWAHNLHVAKVPAGSACTNMGAILNARYRDEMVVFGFSAQQGRYLAYDSGNGVRAFTLIPGKPGTLDHGLASCGMPGLLLDLRRLEPNSGRWFQRRRPARAVGAVSGWNSWHTEVSVVPVMAYDVLVFMRDIDPTTLIPAGG